MQLGIYFVNVYCTLAQLFDMDNVSRQALAVAGQIGFEISAVGSDSGEEAERIGICKVKPRGLSPWIKLTSSTKDKLLGIHELSFHHSPWMT